jgi:hypothetical protein
LLLPRDTTGGGKGKNAHDPDGALFRIHSSVIVTKELYVLTSFVDLSQADYILDNAGRQVGRQRVHLYVFCCC